MNKDNTHYFSQFENPPRETHLDPANIFLKVRIINLIN